MATRPSPSGQDQSESPQIEFTAEPNFLYSNRATGIRRRRRPTTPPRPSGISVPAMYDCVASGVLDDGWPTHHGDEGRTDRSGRSIRSRRRSPFAISHSS